MNSTAVDPAKIQEWLRTTILGIILLGAAGSILALLLIRWIWAPLRTFAGNVYRLFRHRESKAAYSHGRLMGRLMVKLSVSKDVVKLGLYLSYHVALLLVFLAFALFSALIFTLLVILPGRPLLTSASYLAVVASFVAGYGAFYEFRLLRSLYSVIVKPDLVECSTHYKKADSISDA